MLDLILERSNCDIPTLAKRLATRTNETEKATALRLRRWESGHPPNLRTIERDLEAIGLTLELVSIERKADTVELLKDRYQSWILQSNAHHDREISKALRAKALKTLGEIREVMTLALLMPSAEELRWWRSVSLVGDLDWWRAYRSEQAKAAQNHDPEGWASIRKVRYAEHVIRYLSTPAIS